MAPSIPSDLDAFWQKTLARLRSQPLEVQVEKLDQRLPYYVHRLTYHGLDNIPVRAYLALPVDTVHRGREPRPLPAIVGGPGYGGWEFGHQLNECQRGYAVVQVYPRSQGESGQLWSVDKSADRAWVNHGKKSPEGFFYQGAYTDLVRCIDYLVTRPDIDPERIALMGTSQGGMLALGAAAIDTRVRAGPRRGQPLP